MRSSRFSARNRPTAPAVGVVGTHLKAEELALALLPPSGGRDAKFWEDEARYALTALLRIVTSD